MKSNPPFDDSPSGVDLLAIFDTTDRFVGPYRKTSLPPSSMRAHFTLMPRVRSMCCSPTGRCRPGTPCSLTTWHATGYCSMLVVRFPLHSLRDSLFKQFLKTKASDADNLTKGWEGWEGMLVRWANLLRTIAALLSANQPEMACEAQYILNLIR